MEIDSYSSIIKEVLSLRYCPSIDNNGINLFQIIFYLKKN